MCYARHTPEHMSAIITFPAMNTTTEVEVAQQVRVRMRRAMRQALEQYGNQNGIGDLSATIRFACASLLRTDGALPANQKPEAKAS